MSTSKNENVRSVDSTSWVFKLNINNQTTRKFVVSDKAIQWGYWYRGSEDGKKPVDLEPGENKEVLGIRAASGTATGYQCRCTWQDPTKDTSLGNITLYIDVPYSGRNKASFTYSNLVEENGWKKIPHDGHGFTRSVSIYELGSRLVVVEDNDLHKQLHEEHMAFKDSLLQTRVAVEDWNELKKVQVKDSFSPSDVIPSEYTFPPKSFIFSRTESIAIDKKDWNGIGDPIFEELNQKNMYVDEYFAVSFYSINVNPRETQSIAAGVEEATETTVEVTSSIKSTLTSHFSIKDTLTIASKNPICGAEIANQLQIEFSTTDVLEESISRFERECQKISIGAKDYDRIFVQWLLSQAVAIYRKRKNEQIDLVCISEWASTAFDKVYKI